IDLLDLFRNLNSSALDIKKKLGVKGSRIYYYLNPLRDSGIIEESETEEITSHLSRSKFKVTNKFNEALSVMRHDPNIGHRKIFHTFQLNFAISLLQQQLRTLEKLSEEEFNKRVEELDLPHRQFFFVDQETIPLIKKQHNALEETMSNNQLRHGGLVPMMIKSTHVALFGVYKLE
ncbi:MAG: hypothetical protein GPJ54_18850, partial [Candidatus Heimdallarchaeota archaeon]|nr:hypothetical protein [Candidatus Heimdallarchaeota archaeon]